MWLIGEPTEPGLYVLLFEGCEQFIVVELFFAEGRRRLLNRSSLDPCTYIHAPDGSIAHHLPIPEP